MKKVVNKFFISRFLTIVLFSSLVVIFGAANIGSLYQDGKYYLLALPVVLIVLITLQFIREKHNLFSRKEKADAITVKATMENKTTKTIQFKLNYFYIAAVIFSWCVIFKDLPLKNAVNGFIILEGSLLLLASVSIALLIHLNRKFKKEARH